MVGLAVWLCIHEDSPQLIWPAIALVVSLHLIPLAKILHVRPYYVTAIAGSVVPIITFTRFDGVHAVVFLGAGMAMVMWGSAIYLLWKADAICARAFLDPWSV